MPVLPMAPLYEERDTRVTFQRSNDYQSGEDVVVGIQSADDQHLAVDEQGRRQVRTSDVQARW